MGAVVQLCAWSLEALSDLGPICIARAEMLKWFCTAWARSQKGWGGLDRLSGLDVMLWGLDCQTWVRSRAWETFSLRKCEGRTLQSTGWICGGSGSSSLANLLEAVDLNWWPVALQDLVVVGNLFLDRLYTGTEIFLAVVWRAVSIMPFEFAFQCISAPAQGDFLSYFFSFKITWQLDLFIKPPAAWFTI